MKTAACGPIPGDVNGRTESLSPKGTKQPKLIVISAPSGGGKTTLCRMLLETFPNIVRSISTTTRPRRPSEVDGVSYHFLTPQRFQEKIDHGDFAEWAEVHGNRYGISKSTIEDALAKKSKSLEGTGKILPKSFGIVRVNLSADPNGMAPTPPVNVVGGHVFLNFTVAGYDRNAQKKPDVDVSLRSMTPAGQPSP